MNSNSSKHGGRRSGLSATSYNETQDDSQIGCDAHNDNDGSQRSLGTSSLLPAPETTRPPQQLSSRTLISASSQHSITSIATAEEEETRRIAEQLQEDEMLRLAMEQSLSESGFNNVFRPDNHSPMRRSNRSITSVRSAPHGENHALESLAAGPLNQSFRVSRRRRQPARNFQPDYDDDMFDLSPRDESDEQPTPGAVSMLTPPPSLLSVDQKTPSVRAAIASFVERGIAPPFSDLQGAQREERSSGSRKQEPTRTHGESESGRLFSERKREPMTVEVGLAASTEHDDIQPPSKKETNRQRIEQQKVRSFLEQQRDPVTLEPGVRDRGLTSSQFVELHRPPAQRGESASSRKHAGNKTLSDEQKERSGIERDRDPATVEVGLDSGSVRSHTTDRRRPQIGEDNRASRVHPSHHHENEKERPSSEAKRNSAIVERYPVEVNSGRSQASRQRRQSSERARDNAISDDKPRRNGEVDRRGASSERKGESISVDLPSTALIERNATHRSPPSSERLHSDPNLVLVDSEHRTSCSRQRDPTTLDVSGCGSSSVHSERGWQETGGGPSVHNQPGHPVHHIHVDTRHERGGPGRQKEPPKVELTRVNIFKSGDGQTGQRMVHPERKSAWKPVVATRVEQSAVHGDWPVLGQEEDQSGQTEPGTASSYDLSGAEKHLSPEELKLIEMALRESSPVDRGGTPSIDIDEKEDCKMPAQELASENIPQEAARQHCLHDMFPTSTAAAAHQNDGLSEEDSAAIANAILQADKERERRRAEEEKKSLEAIALLMQEEGGNQQHPASYDHKGNIRTMTRAEYDAQQISAQFRTMKVQTEEQDVEDYVEEGYRMNSSAPQRWTRRDLNSVVGPNHEIRTKHDAVLDGQANAHRLGLEGNFAVGNKAFNSFKHSMTSSKKGVATAGSGRAGSDTAGTRAGGLDGSVRVIISRAINNGIIEKCNGVVNEGKEAVVLHADEGLESDGFDVAIKVFKRIEEFRNRGEYVDGDPRYSRSAFGDANSREQLEIWAEKEFRNLMRAHNADVPVPAPLLIKENVVFMRFLGQDWPAPQLKDIDIPRGSQRWKALYDQVMDAVRRLYQAARLVHGDLSEYNILVVPARFLVRVRSIPNPKKTKENTANVSDGDELRAVLIDLAQAVDTRHMSARTFLDRDINTMLAFFSRQGVKVPNLRAAVAYVQTDA